MSSSSHVTRLLDFVRLQGHFERLPGFSSTMGLTWERLSKLQQDRIRFKDKKLQVRLPLGKELLLPGQSRLALSTCAALVDDVTTWALFLSDPKRGRPGVSVSLRAEAGPSLLQPLCDKIDLDLTAQVTKVGKNLGFCTAVIRNADSGGLICTASHVKYLNSMGVISDFLLSSTGWPMLKKYGEYKGDPDTSTAKSMQDLFGPIEYTSDSTAKIPVTPYHASIGGPIHGGAQAVMMDLAATNTAEHQLQSPTYVQSLVVEYLSPPSKSRADLQVESFTSSNPKALSLQVQLMNGKKCSSQGYFYIAKLNDNVVRESKL